MDDKRIDELEMKVDHLKDYALALNNSIKKMQADLKEIKEIAEDLESKTNRAIDMAKWEIKRYLDDVIETLKADGTKH